MCWCHKRWHRNTKLTVERTFFYKQGSRQRHSNWFTMTCDSKEREGGMRDRMMEEDVKLTPLWIFPNTVYYNTVSLNKVCVWKWNQDKKCDREEKSKGSHDLFSVICFERKQSVQRVRGRQDGEDEREIKREKKKSLKYVNLPVSETTQSITIWIKTEIKT